MPLVRHVGILRQLSTVRNTQNSKLTTQNYKLRIQRIQRISQKKSATIRPMPLVRHVGILRPLSSVFNTLNSILNTQNPFTSPSPSSIFPSTLPSIDKDNTAKTTKDSLFCNLPAYISLSGKAYATNILVSIASPSVALHLQISTILKNACLGNL